MKKDSIAYLAIFSFLVCFVFVLPLALANEATKGRVEQNKLFVSRKAVLDVFGLAYKTPEEAIKTYDSSVREIGGAVPVYTARIDGKDHVAVKVSGPGLWGTITVIVAADKDAKKLDGVSLLSQNETPGLGGRIDEPWFQNQFKGETIASAGIKITSGSEALGKGDTDPLNSKLDGITGASRTTVSFETIVNAGIRAIREAGGLK